MSSLNSRIPPREQQEWAARMIPGISATAHPGVKKAPRSVYADLRPRNESTPSPAPTAESVSESGLDLILPRPMKGKAGAYWARSFAADLLVVTSNWLVLGSASLSLQGVFPGIRLVDTRPGASPPLHFLGIGLLCAALITLLGYSEGLYATGRGSNEWRASLRKAAFWSTLLLCLIYGLEGSSAAAVVGLVAGGAVNYFSLSGWRWLRAYQVRRSGPDVRNVFIIGAGEVARRIAAEIDGHPESQRKVCGFLDDRWPLGDGVIGRTADLPRVARSEFVDELILAGPHDRELTLRVLREARKLHLDVEIVPDLFGCNPSHPEVEHVADLPVICLHEERLPSGALYVKRVVDVAGASIGMLLLAPLLALIAAAIKLDSAGPVFYSALRVGRKGRPFHCYKFRTMVSNADELKSVLRDRNLRSGPFFKVANDPRITRVGKVLRRYSLDELPQLWNVLKAEMSLVGPRPHPLDDFSGYEISDFARLDVTPGITGLWQITARRDPSFERGMELDREYISSWSLRLDSRILLKTLGAVIQGSGD